MDWFQIAEGVHQGCILSPRLFNLYAEDIKRNARLDEAQAGIKIARRNINISDMQMIPPLWQRVKRKVKKESEKAGLKLNIQKRRSWHLVPSLHGKSMGKHCKQ